MSQSPYRDRNLWDNEQPQKRRRVTKKTDSMISRQNDHAGDNAANHKPSAVKDNCDDEKSNISISTSSKQAGQTVAPFLAKHIPGQYAPAGLEMSAQAKESKTKYCYRHRPDLKCRRQANEPSMEELQNVCYKPPNS